MQKDDIVMLTVSVLLGHNVFLLGDKLCQRSGTRDVYCNVPLVQLQKFKNLQCSAPEKV